MLITAIHPTLDILVLKVNASEAGKMGKLKVSDFDRCQIAMAKGLVQIISKTAGLIGCSWSAVVSTNQKWSMEGQLVTQQQSHFGGGQKKAHWSVCVTYQGKKHHQDTLWEEGKRVETV